MIEVEQKFPFGEADIARLTAGAEFIGEKTFADTYYDAVDWQLTTHDIWLRQRGDKFELKVGQGNVGGDLARRYDEIEDEAGIRAKLGLPSGGTLTETLATNGYTVFCVCTTTRRKYRKDGFAIDLDTVPYPEFVYHVGEIELMVPDASEVLDAQARILAFIKAHQLTVVPMHGKVVEYLKRARPDHFAALVRAGVSSET